MSLLVVGVNHRSAPPEVLDTLALDGERAESVRAQAFASPCIAESLVLATCNRVEVYAEVTKFHGAVVDVTDALAKVSGLTREQVTPYLYVRYDDRAVQHLFEVTAGLDSLVVGEQQVVGQVRGALREAQQAGSAGRVLHEAGQNALRVGKRVHTETGIARAGASVVSVALDAARAQLGDLSGLRAVVVGAGAMSSLAATALARAGVGELAVAGRTPERAARLAESLPVPAFVVDLADPLALELALSRADVVVSCTGSRGLVIGVDDVRRARAGVVTPLVVLDLALPHDTDEAIGALPGVTRVALADLATEPGAQAAAADVLAARTIIADEMSAFLAARNAARVDPIVASLRARADEVVAAELARLRLRAPGIDDALVAELAHTLRRTVSTLLHTPTVRMKQFAVDPDGARYATALHRLFDLDPAAVSALSESDLSPVGEDLSLVGVPAGELLVDLPPDLGTPDVGTADLATPAESA